MTEGEQSGMSAEELAKDVAEMLQREGVAIRVVSVMPGESWSMPPVIYGEKEDDCRDT